MSTASSAVFCSVTGGGLTQMLARAYVLWAQQPEDTRPGEPPSTVAPRFFYDSMVFDPRGLRFVIDYLGSDCVVLGRDFPAMPRSTRLTDTIDCLDLAPDGYDNFASRDAHAFLGLEPQAVDTLTP